MTYTSSKMALYLMNFGTISNIQQLYLRHQHFGQFIAELVKVLKILL